MRKESQLECVVRKGGVEPPWVSPPDPKSGASANSATLAMHSLALLYCELIAARFSGYSPGPHLRVVFLVGSGSSERGNGRLGETSETDDLEVAGWSVSIAGVDARSESASRRETIGI